MQLLLTRIISDALCHLTKLAVSLSEFLFMGSPAAHVDFIHTPLPHAAWMLLRWDKNMKSNLKMGGGELVLLSFQLVHITLVTKAYAS